MLDFRHETFLKLCTIGSYTKAAEALNITQPAVSQHIKFLEKKYGGKLFCYTGKTLTLTERGQRLYEFASTLSADSSRLEHNLQILHEKDNILSLGATLSIGEYVMPEIIAKILQDEPDVRLHMHVHNTETLLDKLRQGEVDIVLLEGYFDKSAYDWELFSKEEFIAVCSPDSPLANRKVPLSDIFKQRLFIRENGSGTREILEHYLREQNHSIGSFEDICLVGNMSALKELVSKNLGITFLYEVVARKEIEAGLLKKIDISHFSVIRAFNFVFLKGSLHKKEYLRWYKRFLSARG